jgi:hypothetical protein
MSQKECSPMKFLNFRYGLALRQQRSLMLTMLVCTLWISAGLAQQTSPPQPLPQGGSNASAPVSQSEPPRPDWLPKEAVWVGAAWSVPEPLPSQWESFFAWTLHLDEQADLHDKAGKDGSWLRNHLEETIGLTPAEVDLVRDAAQRNQAETKAYNENIFAVIKANWAKHPNVLGLPLPPECTELAKQRDEATMRVASDLEEHLGPEATAKLETWRAKYWAAPRTNEHGSLPPGAEEAWRELNKKRYQEMKTQEEQHNQEKLQQQPNGQQVH